MTVSPGFMNEKDYNEYATKTELVTELLLTAVP